MEAELRVRCPDSKGSGPPGAEEMAVVKAAEHLGGGRRALSAGFCPREGVLSHPWS